MTQKPDPTDSVDNQLEGEQEGGEHLVPEQPEDNDTPFTPAGGGTDGTPAPQTDTKLDSQETYDEGLPKNPS